MSFDTHKFLGTAFMTVALLATLAASLATTVAVAQESPAVASADNTVSDFDALAPAVGTSADAPAVDTSVDAPVVDTSVDSSRDSRQPQVDDTADSGDRELIDPAVPSAVFARDATRTQMGGQVMDRMELGRTEITGNQELPKVLYIVPWQKADPGDLLGRPVNTLLDEVLAPLDREEFVREVDYYGDLYGDEL